MPCSGGPGTPELKGRGQAAHLNGVARIGVSIAQGLKEEVSHFAVDMDEVIAGGLCHDLGEAWEYDPANRERWADHRITGEPSLRHPLFGVFVALTAGLPEQIAHIAGTHSAEGRNIPPGQGERALSGGRPAQAVRGRAGVVDLVAAQGTGVPAPAPLPGRRPAGPRIRSLDLRHRLHVRPGGGGAADGPPSAAVPGSRLVQRTPGEGVRQAPA